MVNDRREGNTDSPFEVEYWAVSLDWRLIAFDRNKRAAGAARVPAILYPSNLVQLLQFWIPRSHDLEEGLVDSLRLPLFFQSFDPEDERATVKVLEALSRFENISDLPEATLKVVLANQALRGRLREADASNDEIFELVREEVLAEHQNTVNVLQETKGVLAITEASLAEERLNREKSEQTLVSSNARLNDAEAKLAAAQQQAAEAEALAKQAELDAQTKLKQKDLELSATESALLSLYKQRFAVTFVLVPVVIGVIVGYLIYPHALGLIPDPAKIWGVWVLTAACGIFPLTLACAAGHWYVARHQKLETWWLARFVLVGKKALVAPALMAGSSAFQGGVWDGIKSIVGW